VIEVLNIQEDGMHEKTVQFKFTKSTRNTHKYDEIGNDPAVGQIYFQKSFLGEDPPVMVEATFRVGLKLREVGSKMREVS